MRTAPELRYTDRDVREDATLKLAAIEYLEGYGGEFDPLVRAQNMLTMDGDLTTVMTRTVLNCMRNDERCVLPAPRGYTMPRRPQTRQPRIVNIGYYRKCGQTYSYSCHLKFDYVINLHRQSRWYHKIDHSRTMLQFCPQDWPDNGWGRPNTLFVSELRGMCGTDLSHALGRTRFLGTLEDAQESDNEFCPRCLHGHRDAGWKP